jgi:three-Cys-motif partner protein
MTPIHDDFFDHEQHEASRLKVEAYGKYLRPLAYKLLSRYKRLYVVDGFAGAGRYAPDDSGCEAAGSPLVAAQIAHQYNVDHHGEERQIGLINVERNADYYTRLCHNLAGFGDLCLNLPGRFDSQLDRILHEIGRHPALFFLDSFGMEAADVRIIDAILARRDGCVTEFLIHFSDKALTRIAGNLDAKTTREADFRAAQSKLRNVDEIIGSPWWRGCFTNPQFQTAEQRCDAAAALYMHQLEQRYIPFVNELRMRDAYDDPPRYRLIFATRNAHGTYLMSDIAAKHEAKLFSARYDGSFDTAWKREERASERITLREEIHAWGLQRGTARPLDVYMHFSPIHFARWEIHDFDECLRELVDKGAIDRKSRHGIKDRDKLKFLPIAQGTLFGSATA